LFRKRSFALFTLTIATIVLLLAATAYPFKSESLAQNDPPSTTSATSQGQADSSTQGQQQGQSQQSSGQGQQQQSGQQSQGQAGSSSQDQVSSSQSQQQQSGQQGGSPQGQQDQGQSQQSSGQGQQQQQNQQNQQQVQSRQQNQQEPDQQQIQLQKEPDSMAQPAKKGPDPKINSNKNKYRDYHETIFIDGKHMKKPGHDYKVRFYDSDNRKLGACVVRTDDKGRFENAFYTIKGTEKPGTWHAEAGPAGENITEDTCYFEVLASAIPEFPTVVAGIAVPGMCAFIYGYLRKRNGALMAS